MAAPIDDRRKELAAFLRERRERVAPDDVGLPKGSSRRRVAGLRREELAILAGVSPTWYTYLEQGRSIQVSPQVLDSLSRVLGLNEDERRYLHRLSYGYVAGALHAIPDEVAEYDAVLASFDTEWPVYIADAMCDILSWNAANTEWYTDWAAMGEQPNILVWIVTDPAARERLVEWEAVGRDLVARCRAAIAVNPALYRARLERLDAMMAEHPQLRDWWSSLDVSELRLGTRLLNHPVHGQRRFHTRTFLSAADNGVGIVFHVPTEP